MRAVFSSSATKAGMEKSEMAAPETHKDDLKNVEKQSMNLDAR